ncbi:hypothetical protein F7725_004913 [Dissostichus mawsoni]|uniref:Dachshund n=1 Tax=Dissostichus mawsoni TaxID=36200 RepID=A0A7J5XLM8_DISMA|nr:hypothetical protein F7725_004913 [Dissostichus mawsoni]
MRRGGEEEERMRRRRGEEDEEKRRRKKWIKRRKTRKRGRRHERQQESDISLIGLIFLNKDAVMIAWECLTAAAMAELQKFQKMKMMMSLQNGNESDNDDLHSNTGLDLPFMMMPHPLLPMGLPPASVAMAMSQMNHLNTIANMAAAAQQIHTHVHRAPVIK